ncbi:MAG TPA: S-layer homology domain-containing protein [Chloroflexia bacterium]
MTFSDVPSCDGFYPFVYCLACRGVIGGYADATYRPGDDVTRGQLSKIVALAAGFSEPVSGQRFSDVPPGSTFYEFIERLADRGIIGGYADGTFRPGANATRGQISKIVSNAAGFNEDVSGETFADVPTGSPFYIFIERLSSRKVLGGYACGRPSEPCDDESRPYFRSNYNVTRAQIAKIVANTFFPGCASAAGPTCTPQPTSTATPMPTHTPVSTNTPMPPATQTPCTQGWRAAASVSNPAPSGGSVIVYGWLTHNCVRVPNVQMHTVWDFGPATTTCDGVTAADGVAQCSQTIEHSTPGYPVFIDVIFYLPGGGTVETSASFTPF